MSPRLAHFAAARAVLAVLAALSAPTLAGCLKIPTGDTPARTPADERPAEIVAWPGKPPAALYTPGETRVFDLIQGGKKIGASWARYDGPLAGGLHQFSTRVELRAPTTDARNTAPPEPLRSVGEIVLDARGELLRGFERSRAVELRFERSDETLVFTTGREREELGFRPGTAFMAFATMFHEELMFGLRELKEGPLAWRLISLSGSLPSDWSATPSLATSPSPTTSCAPAPISSASSSAPPTSSSAACSCGPRPAASSSAANPRPTTWSASRPAPPSSAPPPSDPRRSRMSDPSHPATPDNRRTVPARPARGQVIGSPPRTTPATIAAPSLPRAPADAHAARPFPHPSLRPPAAPPAPSCTPARG